MDLKTITDIVNSNMPDSYKETGILLVIAKDEKVIPNILEILNNERQLKKELLLDTNEELSRALIVLKDKKLTAKRGIIAQPSWVVGKIVEHYKKWRGVISCTFPLNLEDDND